MICLGDIASIVAMVYRDSLLSEVESLEILAAVAVAPVNEAKQALLC